MHVDLLSIALLSSLLLLGCLRALSLLMDLAAEAESDPAKTQPVVESGFSCKSLAGGESDRIGSNRIMNRIESDLVR